MTRTVLALALFCLGWIVPGRAFNWQTATARGRDYVTLQSFCQFYNFSYSTPGGNTIFEAHSPNHIVRFNLGSTNMYLDGVHYVMSFPVEGGSGDWLVSRMDVIKVFEPIMRPREIAGLHAIRGVVIDAGHGGSDNGATSRLGSEKNYTIDTALRLERILNDAGIKTVLTRRNDIFVDLYERAHIASMYSDYAFVSIHFNSASAEAQGLETYCLAPRGAASTSSNYLTRADIQTLPGNDEDAQNILLASAVHSEIIRLNPGETSMDRGVKRARFVVIKANQLPAILVEGGFVSNRMEAARVNSSGYRQALAQAIARGLIKFANVMGGRHTALPSEAAEDTGARPQAVVPPPTPANVSHVVSPSGATTNAAGKKHAPKVAYTTPQPATPATSHKSKKKGKQPKVANTSAPAANASALTPMSPAASQTVSPPPAGDDAATGTKSAPLGLSEGAAPAPTPGAEKAPPEPDEPPTVNTGEARQKSTGSSTNAPAEHEP